MGVALEIFYWVAKFPQKNQIHSMSGRFWVT